MLGNIVMGYMTKSYLGCFLVGLFSPNIKMQLTRMHVNGKAPNYLNNRSECVNLHFSLGKTEEFLSG